MTFFRAPVSMARVTKGNNTRDRERLHSVSSRASSSEESLLPMDSGSGSMATLSSSSSLSRAHNEPMTPRSSETSMLMLLARIIHESGVTCDFWSER